MEQTSEEQKKFINNMEIYLKTIQDKPKDISKKEAKESLRRTGITDKNGKLKKSIISR